MDILSGCLDAFLAGRTAVWARVRPHLPCWSKDLARPVLAGSWCDALLRLDALGRRDREVAETALCFFDPCCDEEVFYSPREDV